MFDGASRNDLPNLGRQAYPMKQRRYHAQPLDLFGGRQVISRDMLLHDERASKPMHAWQRDQDLIAELVNDWNRLRNCVVKRRFEEK